MVPALELLISDWAYGLSRRRVTVSTSGIVPHNDKLAEDCNVVRPVEKNRVLTYDDVEIPEGRTSDRLRAEQDAHFTD